MHSKLSYFIRINKTLCQSNLPEASAQSQNKFYFIVHHSIPCVCTVQYGAHVDAISSKILQTNRQHKKFFYPFDVHTLHVCTHRTYTFNWIQAKRVVNLVLKQAQAYSHPDHRDRRCRRRRVYFLHEVLANVAAGKGRRQNFWHSLHTNCVHICSVQCTQTQTPTKSIAQMKYQTHKRSLAYTV